MKRLTLCISILWISTMVLGMVTPEVRFEKKKENPVVEQNDSDSTEESETFQVSTAKEAILSVFQFEASSSFSLIPKLFVVFENEVVTTCFQIRDFSVIGWKKLFTRIIQVHGP